MNEYLPAYFLTPEFLTIYFPVIVKMALAIIFPIVVMSGVPILVWLERRGAGFIQDRLGPNRSNIFGFTFWGLLHPINDAIKMVMKESFAPARAKLFFYYLAPAIVVIPAVLTFAVIPVAAPIVIGQFKIPLQIATLDSGILYILAISSLGVYGLVIGGWASGNKYSLLGAVRSASQMLSYEVTLGLSLVTIFMIYSGVEPYGIVESQGGLLFGAIPNWGIFLSPVAFILFLISSYAESNRTPFDLPEADAEIVAGYHLEYGALKFAMFMMAEYISMITMSAIVVTMFFGGYQIPYLPTAKLVALVGAIPAAILQIFSFSAKTLFFGWLYIWIRWTLPRFRYDQVMKLCYLNMFPIAMANIFITAAVILFIK